MHRKYYVKLYKNLSVLQYKNTIGIILYTELRKNDSTELYFLTT